MRVKKNTIKEVKMGYYNKLENIYYIYDNKYIDMVKKLYPKASIQLCLF